jgi:hypothetical protein
MSDKELTHIDFYGKDGWLYGWLSLTEDNTLSLQICKIHKGSISICDLGHTHSLNNITQVPFSGFTNPQPLTMSLKCKTGHGYVVKLDIETLKRPMYIRLYYGEKLEHQYPFEKTIVPELA